MSKGLNFGNLRPTGAGAPGAIAKVQEKAASRTVEGSAGGGMVKATVNGRLEVVQCADRRPGRAGGDIEMLQDLVVAAVNQGIRAAQQLMADEMSKLTAA